MLYNYKIFECNVESDIPIFLLENTNPTTKTIDIQVSEDKKLSDDLIHFKKSKKNYYKTNLTKTEIYIEGIALFNINDRGFSINYIFDKTPDMTSFFSKLLNHVIPYALYMQKRFILHASGVSFNNEGFIFLGRSGAGKSSLAASLKGMSFACEDSAMIKNYNGELFLIPSFNLVKLSSEIYGALGLHNEKVANVHVDKLNRNLYKVKNFLDHSTKLKRCYILKWGENFKIQKMDSKNVFRYIYSSIFGPHPIDSCKESELFIYNKVAELIKNIEFYELHRNKKNLFSDNNSIIKHMQADHL